MVKLSATQAALLDRWTLGDVKSAYGARTSLPTCQALVRKGYLKDVTSRGPGGMFSPQTHYQYKRIK